MPKQVFYHTCQDLSGIVYGFHPVVCPDIHHETTVG